MAFSFGQSPANASGQQPGTPLGTTQTAFSFGTPSTGLFGNSSAGQQPSSLGFGQQPTNSIGLFGQKPSTPVGGSLFGQQPANNTGGSLFGQQPTNNAVGSLFGQQSANPSGGSLFGQQSTNTTGGSLFGQQSTNTAGGSLFGQQPITNAGGSLFGQQNSQFGSQVQPAQTQYGQTQQPPVNLLPSTQFRDLPDQFKNEIVALHQYIQQQKALAAQLQAQSPAHSADVSSTSTDVGEISRRISLLNLSLKFSSHNLSDVRKLLEKAESDVTLVGTLVTSILSPQNPQQSLFRTNGSASNGKAPNMQPYYQSLLKMWSAKLQEYRDQLSQLEEVLSNSQTNGMSISANLDDNSTTDPATLLISVVQRTWNDFIVLSASVAQIHDQIRSLQEKPKEH